MQFCQWNSVSGATNIHVCLAPFSFISIFTSFHLCPFFGMEYYERKAKNGAEHILFCPKMK